MDARQDRARQEAEADRERLALGLEPAGRLGQRVLPTLVVGRRTACDGPQQLCEGDRAPVVGLDSEADGVIEARLELLEVALKEGQDGAEDPRRRSLVWPCAWQGGNLVHPAAPLSVAAAHVPVARERATHAQRGGSVVAPQGSAQHRAKVVVLASEAVQPLHLLGG